MELLKVSKDKRALKFIKKRVSFPPAVYRLINTASVAASAAQRVGSFRFCLQHLKLLHRFGRASVESVFSFKSLGLMLTVRRAF